MHKFTILIVAALAFAALPASAGIIGAYITLNTPSGVSAGTTWVDFQFNPGNVSPDFASASVSVLSTDFVFGPGLYTTGHVTGSFESLPIVLVTDDPGYNPEYGREVATWGTFLRLLVTFSGPAIGTPGDLNGFKLALQDSDGNSQYPTALHDEVASIVFNDDGSVTTYSGLFSDNVSTDVTLTPEPGSCALLASGIALAFWMRRRAARA